MDEQRPGRPFFRALGEGLIAIFFAVFIATSGLPPAQAGDGAQFCVRCSSPDVNYLCSRNDAFVADTAMKFYCIERASKQAGHAFCSIQKNASSCINPKMTFIYTHPAASPSPALPSAHDDGAAKDIVGPVLPDGSDPGKATPAVEGEGAQTADGKPPRTLAEATSHMARDAKRGMENVGSSVSNAVKNTGAGIKGAAGKTGEFIKETGKKSWNCLTSLFTKC